MAALSFRTAIRADLPELIRMLADDPLGESREDVSAPPNPRYEVAFRHIEQSPDHEILIAEKASGIVGMLQLSYLPGLSRLGALRCQIEGVRVAASVRGQGIGKALFEESIRRARDHDCTLIQLTTDKSRPDAHRFYESLGFIATHEGYKLSLL